MICPKCNSGRTGVYGGHDTEYGNYQRYRKCLDCGYKFRSLEYYVTDEKGGRKKNDAYHSK